MYFEIVDNWQIVSNKTHFKPLDITNFTYDNEYSRTPGSVPVRILQKAQVSGDVGSLRGTQATSPLGCSFARTVAGCVSGAGVFQIKY